MLDAEPYMGRQDYQPPPTEEPFPFRLEKLSLDSLSKYVCCEAPPLNQIRSVQQASFGSAQRRWADVAPFVNRVGALYAKLYWLFMDEDDAVDGWTNFPVDLFRPSQAGRHISEPRTTNVGRQLGPREWGTPVVNMMVLSCTTRREARDAIRAIAGQGEGGPATHDSHFDQLLDVHTIAQGTPSRLAFDVPTAPTLLAGRPGTIDHPDALALIRLTDAFYNLVIVQVLLALAMDTGDPIDAEVRRSLLDASFADMNHGVLAAARWLSRNTPRRFAAGATEPDDERAAPLFGLCDPVQGGRVALCSAFAEQIRHLENAIDVLWSRPLARETPDFLKAVAATATKRRALLGRLRAIS
jgi:hypothetical protein